jgi:hypothetical protein
MPVSHRVDSARVHYLLTNPAGGVARDLLKRGLKVETRAKLLLAGGAGRPKRIDTGRLRTSIHTVPLRDNGIPIVRVGTGVWYAMLIHDGTGLYGPRHRRIRPIRAKALRFRPKGSARYVYARSVAGMKPNHFLADALSAAGRSAIGT